MVQFILTTILMLSLGGILYLVIRSLPRIQEDAEANRGVLERFITSEIPGKLDALTNSFLEKSLRKTKVFLLRVDNIIAEQLKRIRPEGSNQQKAKIDFKEIVSERNGDGKMRHTK